MSRKRQKLTDPVLPPAFEDSLRQQLSEVISLREKVAQAELEARRRGKVAEESPHEKPLQLSTISGR